MIIYVDDIKNHMKTINRKPIKTWWTPTSTKIEWRCHGINQHGKRIYWDEVTCTQVTLVFNPMFDKYQQRYNTERFVGPFAIRI